LVATESYAASPPWFRWCDAEIEKARKFMRGLMILGILALLVGLLWIGQGTGAVNWPQSSFMISQIQWAWYGAALAVVGLLLIWRGRR
jgi:di/tricarboxylate transporter